MIYSLGLRECSLFKLLCVKSLFLSFCALQEETTCIDVQVKPICASPSSGKSVLRIALHQGEHSLYLRHSLFVSAAFIPVVNVLDLSSILFCAL